MQTLLQRERRRIRLIGNGPAEAQRHFGHRRQQARRALRLAQTVMPALAGIRDGDQITKEPLGIRHRDQQVFIGRALIDARVRDFGQCRTRSLERRARLAAIGGGVARPLPEVGRFESEQTGAVERDIRQTSIDGTHRRAARAEGMNAPHRETEHDSKQTTRQIDSEEQQSVTQIVHGLVDHHHARGRSQNADL